VSSAVTSPDEVRRRRWTGLRRSGARGPNGGRFRVVQPDDHVSPVVVPF
jgi:hypothetical protein